ncbi:hypothetical protein [Rhizobium sp. P44RR-XXIV]|uniref:hypothetical protein n=1 Tax=Rhizobium sp. P44RR-XXIV TaxID=1921145 RepID=UPI0010AA0DD3|nr:hypothetical protein [Rhizobium sp. P44RR-XXIV]TIX92659.1 hypothetical protein BSK43_004550 [Rhizobium sp. P44RR-XXIV]
MHLVVMKIVGTVFRLEGTPWDYQNNVRPLAFGLGGFATCEVVLPEPNGLITKTPQSAELHFPRIVQFEEAAGEIDLYDGPKLVMRFRPLTLADLQAIAATA